jgi:hypothetical protein
MARPQVVLDLAGDHQLARDLAAGGVFVPGCAAPIFEDVELVVRSGSAAVSLAARVVFVNTSGAGLELIAPTAEQKQQLAALAGDPKPTVAEPEPAAEPDAEPEPEANEAPEARSVRERLRNLTLVQQHKLAQHGETTERIMLERIYGKTVWEHLLRNPRVTGPEVARIARMGSLPRTLLELICGNGAWLQIGEIRRALLSNQRLGTDQILRVLKLLAKPELKLAAMQTAYPFAVRDAAKRMLKDK